MITSAAAYINTPATIFSFEVNKYGDVREKHRLIEEATHPKRYKSLTKELIEELVNNSNFEGVTRISQATLANKINCTTRTIRNHLIKLQTDGFIKIEKNGWQETNTVTLLPIYYKSNNKAENFSDDLNNLNLRDRDLNKYNCKVDVNLVNEYEKEMSKRCIHPPDKPKLETKESESNENKRKVFDNLIEIGLTLKNVKIFMALIKRLGIAKEVVLQALDIVKAKKCDIRNLGAYFYGVLMNLHNEHEINRRERGAIMSKREEIGYHTKTADHRPVSEASVRNPQDTAIFTREQKEALEHWIERKAQECVAAWGLKSDPNDLFGMDAKYNVALGAARHHYRMKGHEKLRKGLKLE